MAGFTYTGGAGVAKRKFVSQNTTPLSGPFDKIRFFPEETLSDVGGWGEVQHSHTECGSHTRRDGGECSRQGGGGRRGRGGNQDSGNREPERRRWESKHMGGTDNKGMAWPASPVATRCQGNPCSTGIRWGVSPAAQMGCLRSRRGCPPGADQP